MDRTPIMEQSLASLEQPTQMPSVDDFIFILQKCRREKNSANARFVHVHIHHHGLEHHQYLGSYLTAMLVECGSMPHAQQLFNKLTHRNEHAWTSLMHGYVACGEPQLAINLFHDMQDHLVCPSNYTFLTLLKACGRLKHEGRGQEVHTEIIRNGTDRDAFVANALVDMYAKCGSLAEAREVFDKLAIRDVVSWNTLIAGYIDHRLGHDALKCLEQMQLEDKPPNVVTFVCGLKACTTIGVLQRGRELHALIAVEGFDEDSFISNTLVDMYAKCGSLVEARDLFDELPVRDVVSWTALITGYAELGQCEEVFNCLDLMQWEGVAPNAVTFVCSLKACGSTGAVEMGQKLHVEISKEGFERDLSVGNALVDMYAKCSSLADMLEVFHTLPVRDIVSWNTLITGYADHGLGEEALNCLEQMQLEGKPMNAVTFVCSLKACGSVGAIDRGLVIHAEIIKDAIEGDVLVSSTLVDMYAKCGFLTEAREVFDEIQVKDDVSRTALIAGYAKTGLLAEAQEMFAKLSVRGVISWTALITGFVEHAHFDKVLNYMEQLKLEGVSPNAVTFCCSLKACGMLGAMDRGQETHVQILKEGFERDLTIGNTLLDMYAKCGSLAEAQGVFDSLSRQDVVSWNALAAGYARQGDCELVFYVFERMRENGILPDGTTFLSVLIVCSHAGLIHKGKECFEAMTSNYKVSPSAQHYNCMVDLLGRAGQLNEAVALSEMMTSCSNSVTWKTVLGACQKWGDVELGIDVFEHAVNTVQEHAAATFALMSNIYADAVIKEG